MDAHFSIRVDPVGNRVDVTMGGFFTQADVAAFRLALEREMAALTCRPNQHVVLCDVTAMKIQTQDIVAAFGGIVGHPSVRSRRLAFITGSSLARMQTRRLTDREGVGFFADPVAAEAWLSERADPEK